MHGICTRGALTLLAVLAVAGVTFAQTPKLGTFDFPTSTSSAEAQEHFLVGVGLVHSFEWEDAIEAFQRAQEADPEFVMAYWGEAVSHTRGHHFSPDQNISGGRAALRKLGPSRAERLAEAPTERERGYLEAVEILYGAGDAKARLGAYAEAMGRLAEKYPDDHEAQTLHAIALMRAVVRGEESLRNDQRAGAIAQTVFRENEDHPGAAHYIIHAFDDPIHAPIGLYAAHKYAKIAPDAVHALHMPSHIFVQHGMWDHLAASNEASYASSVARAERKGLPPTRRSFHALYWLQYAYLQQGRYAKAQECIDMIAPVAARDDARRGIKNNLAIMEARYTIETERWRTTPGLDDLVQEIAKSDPRIDRYAAGAVLLAAAMSAARTGDLATAQKSERGLQQLHDLEAASGDTSGVKQIAILHKEAAAVVKVAQRDLDGALAIMQEATELEDTMVPPSGPPGESKTDGALKPSHELRGELLLEADRAEEAAAVFAEALFRTPNRPRSLLGAARAAVKLGNDAGARQRYTALTAIPGGASDVPGLEEARGYLGGTSQP